MKRPWFLLDSGAGTAALNMAIDEALLEAMPRLLRPVLRFYGWAQAAASFGYFQRYIDVERLTPLRPLMRRPTAGGIVPHDADWTYSLAVPVSDPWYHLKAVQSYRAIHEWLHAAFAQLGIETEVAPAPNKNLAGQCFVGHEQFDLLWRGGKIAGAAQRRTRCGLLIQGSVQPPSVAPARAAWQAAMKSVGTIRHQADWNELQPDETLMEKILLLMDAKYLRDEYHRKR